MARSSTSLEQTFAGLTDDEQHALAALAVVGKTTLDPVTVARLAGVDRAAAAVSSLGRRGLIQEDEQGTQSALGSIGEHIRKTEAGIETGERLLDALTTLARADQLGPEEIEAIFGLTGWAAETAHWRGLLELVETAESTFAFLERFRDRVALLERGLEAARQLGDETAEAELLHALGRGRSARDDGTQNGPAQGGGSEQGRSAPARIAVRAGALALVGGIGLAAGYVLPHADADTASTIPVTATVPVTLTGPGGTVTSLATITDQQTVTTPPETVTVVTTVFTDTVVNVN
ncbi:MAG TPA: hypothetical protein VH306_11275 [Gaiellaceae bacterium]